MITEMIRKFRKKLNKGPVLGPFSKTEDPAMVEAMGHAGFDFLILDLEHGPNSVRSLQNLVRAAQLSGILPIVRVKEDLPNVIGEVLDISAGGVQVPKITAAGEARAVIQAAKFAPLGMRGVCRYVRAADYSAKDRFEYFKEANEALVILHLEGRKALENAGEIISVPGVDVVFIGPYDLAQSLGIMGQVDHPAVAGKLREIVKLCAPKGIAVGTFVETPRSAAKWIKLGVRYISYKVDTGIMLDAGRQIVGEIMGKRVS
jgi:4-hydroxy-2-oxoheptanedioate aldolase